MNYKLLIIGLLALILMYGCQKESLPQKSIAEMNPCAAILCNQNQVCVEGDCVCVEGFKACNDACIPHDACCTDKECLPGYCKNTTCVSRCADVFCEFNKECQETTGQCTCPKDTKWCERQKQCIPFDVCCTNADCRVGKICTPYSATIEVCLEGTTTFCKQVGLNSPRTLDMDGKKIEVIVTAVEDFSKADLMVDAKNFTGVSTLEKQDIGHRMQIYVTEIKPKGGICEDNHLY